MVSITTPFKGDRVEGLNVAERLGYDGSFRYIAHDIDLWHFRTSLPANKARMSDFLLDSNVSVSSDLVLPSSPKLYVPELSFDTILYHVHRRVLDVVKQQCHQMLLREDRKYIMLSDKWEDEFNGIFSESDVIKRYEEPYELQANYLLARQIKDVVEPWGYQVLANASKFFKGEHPINSSRFSKSRPDLIVFNLDTNCVVAAMEELEDEVKVLQGAAGECKVYSFSSEENALPQLLGNLEKVVGDVVQERLMRGKKKHFDEMILYVLLINYQEKSCKVYKLHLDFIKRSSFLEHGKETIPLSDAINNLLFHFDPGYHKWCWDYG